MNTVTFAKSRPLPGSERPDDWEPGWFGYEGDPRRWLAPEGDGSIELPESPDWSPLCRELVEEAASIALGMISYLLPIERWGGCIPYIDRSDLLVAASDLDDEIPLDEVFAAVREAMRFIGIDT